MAFDPMDEYKDRWGFNQFIPTKKRSNAELDRFIDQVIKPSKDAFDMMVVDECNRYHKKNGNLTGPVAEITDWGTSHWNLGAIFIARRPSQVHTDIIELADYLFIHRLTGDNDMKKLRSIHPDLPAEVQKISGPEGKGEYPQYSCIMVKPGNTFEVIDHIPEMDNDKATS
jgi:hypothetical protein